MVSPARSYELKHQLELLRAGEPRTVRELEALVKANSPKIIFLAETRQRGVRLSHLRWRLGLKNFVAVDSFGKSGGLAVFWHE
ncbi:hypothetical protein C2845_PM17G06640 [Panicum miliaceum]|uniref:Uncharacterized protein n=1 Tax=Panicum miliaceum TaxID=4540 RepID=A0A3L6Q547_PANMI|nr:hypothetical protein C2845_PM17G06640 [Panicum miliaceum]